MADVGKRFCVYKRPDIALFDLGQACNDYDESGASDDFQNDYVWKRKLQESDFDINELINTSKLRNPKPYRCNKTPCFNIACKYASAEMVAFLLLFRANPFQLDEGENLALDEVYTTEIDMDDKLALLLSIDRLYSSLDDATKENIVQLVNVTLLKATEQGKVHTVKVLLQNGADPNTANKYGFTVIHYASLEGRLNIAQILLEHGAKVNLRNNKLWTPLHAACENGHSHIAQLLLNSGAEMNALGKDNCTPLILASHRGHIPVIQLLLYRGADIELFTVDKGTAMYYACQEGHVHILRLLHKHGANIEARFKTGATPLIVASQNGHTLVVQDLIQRKANIEAHTVHKATALYVACQKGHVDIIRLLVKHGANIEARYKTGATPLIIASETGQSSLVKELLSFNASVDAYDSNKETALHYASQKGYVEIVQLMLSYGANPNSKAKSSDTPLTSAIDSHNINAIKLKDDGTEVNVMELLIENGAEINTYLEWNVTPLHHAVERKNLQAVEIFLNHGANVNAQDKYGKTALHFSSEFANENVTQRLLTSGADPNLQDVNGNTSVHVAAERGHVEILKVLISSNLCNLDIRNRKACDPLNTAQDAGQPHAAKCLASYLKTEPEITEQQRFARLGNNKVEEDDFQIVVGRIVNTKSKTKTPVTYNVSSFLREIERRQRNFEHLEQFVAEIDRKITVEKCFKHHKILCDGVRLIAQNICNELGKSDKRFRNIKLIKAGSLFSGLKVGLPYEADFLLETELTTKDLPILYELCDCIKDMDSRKMLANTNGWFLHSVDQNRVGAALNLEYTIQKGESIGFSVDLVPIYKRDNSENKVHFTEKAQMFLKHKGLLKESQADIFTLLSPDRDHDYDTGILVSKILCCLTEEQKRGFRIAKYLIQTNVVSQFKSHGDLDKLYGDSPLVRSFHLRLCFLHLLIASCDKQVPALTSGKLALCLLHMIKTVFRHFGTRDWEQGEHSCFLDPLIKDNISNDSIEFKYKLHWVNSAFKYFAADIATVTDKFLSDVASRDLSQYKLLIYTSGT